MCKIVKVGFCNTSPHDNKNERQKPERSKWLKAVNKLLYTLYERTSEEWKKINHWNQAKTSKTVTNTVIIIGIDIKNRRNTKNGL